MHAKEQFCPIIVFYPEYDNIFIDRRDIYKIKHLTLEFTRLPVDLSHESVMWILLFFYFCV